MHEDQNKDPRSADEYESQDELIARLVALDGPSYLSERKLAAKNLNWPVSELDKIVKSKRKKSGTEDDERQGGKLYLQELDPWHGPVDGQALIDRLVHSIRDYVVLSYDEALGVALWILFAHAHDWFFTSPRLHISSPEKQCGKSTLLRVIGPMVPRHLGTENITGAALFRTIEAYRPTLLIDEADTFINDSEDTRGILNAGHQKDGVVIRTVGDDYEPRTFSVWCPIVIAGIGRIPATLEDRSVQIRLHRRIAGERVKRLRLDRREHLAEIGSKAARWISDHEQSIRAGDPDLPDALSDRGRDNWRPLVTIADVINPECGERARAAAIAISGLTGDDDTSVNVMALADIWNLFEERRTDRLPTSDLVNAFNDMDERPWAEWRRGKGMSGSSLSRLLKPFKIRPKDIRFGQSVVKGYTKEVLADAYQRYVKAPNAPATPIPVNRTATPQHLNEINELGEIRTATNHVDVADGNGVNPLKYNDCSGVADGNPGNGHGGHVSEESDGIEDLVAAEWDGEL
jgi:putative DNA primase/helicase